MSQDNEKTILVVDDEIGLQQLIKIALKSRGYRVETANNGLDALTKLATVTPHLIILDLNMPKMGGLEFYERICDSKNQPRYPVFVLSARANMTKLFKEFKINGFMTKPFEVDELLSEVDTIVRKKPSLVIKVAGESRPPKMCIVDDDQEALNKIGGLFLNTGYSVNSASNGTEAIERIYVNLPDIALVKLGLRDIAGDVVIMQLKRMVKTTSIKFILYAEHVAEKTVVIDKISKKEGIDCFIQYSNFQQLLNGANELLQVKL